MRYLALLFAILLAACGGGGDQPTPSSDPPVFNLLAPCDSLSLSPGQTATCRWPAGMSLLYLRDQFGVAGATAAGSATTCRGSGGALLPGCSNSVLPAMGSGELRTDQIIAVACPGSAAAGEWCEHRLAAGGSLFRLKRVVLQ